MFSVLTKEPNNFESFVVFVCHLTLTFERFRSSCAILFKSNSCVFNPNQRTRHISNLFLNQTYVFSISTKEPGSFESTVLVKKIEDYIFFHISILSFSRIVCLGKCLFHVIAILTKFCKGYYADNVIIEKY